MVRVSMCTSALADKGEREKGTTMISASEIGKEKAHLRKKLENKKKQIASWKEKSLWKGKREEERKMVAEEKKF